MAGLLALKCVSSEYMKRFFTACVGYFLTLFISASIVSYFSYGKHAIESNGFLGESPVFNTLADYPVFCLVSFFVPFLVVATICALLSKRKHFTNVMLIVIVYIGVWLIASTAAASGSAVNHGTTWTKYEIFHNFVVGQWYSLPLLIVSLSLNFFGVSKHHHPA